MKHCRWRRAVIAKRKNQPGPTLPGETEACGPRFIGAAPGERDGDDGEDSCYRKPISYRPEECKREVPVAVHIRIGVEQRTADQIERVFQSKVIEDRRNDEDTNNDAAANEFVGDYSLDKEC